MYPTWLKVTIGVVCGVAIVVMAYVSLFMDERKPEPSRPTSVSAHNDISFHDYVNGVKASLSDVATVNYFSDEDQSIVITTSNRGCEKFKPQFEPRGNAEPPNGVKVMCRNNDGRIQWELDRR